MMNLARALFGISPMPPIGAAGRGFLILGLYVVLCAATLSPLLWVSVPALVDYPNHLARMWILVHRTDIPELARDYVVHWRILPDLAMDFVVPVLSTAMPIEVAGRVFIALTMLGLIAGTATLHRVLHGRFAVWPVWSVLFVYNAVLFWGFLSCLFAIAVYLFVFSFWIATREWPMVPRILVFSVAGAILFLLHLFAFGLYGLSVLSYEVGRRLDGRRLPLTNLASCAVVCLQFVPGLLLWYASLGNVDSAFTGGVDFGHKLYALLAPVDFGVSPALLDTGLGLAVVVFLLLFTRHRALTLAPEMRLPVGAMIVTALVMPYSVNGSAFADIRLPVALPFVILASTQFMVSRKWLPPLLGGVALFGFALRIWTVSQCWKDYDRWFNEVRAGSAVITPAARLLVIEAPMSGGQEPLTGVPAWLATLQPLAFWHLGALTVIDRSAFYPYLFTGPTPVGVTPGNALAVEIAGALRLLLNSADPKKVESLYRDWPQTFDRRWSQIFEYVLWIDFGGAPKPPLKQLRPVASGSFFEIYQTIKQ
jgi:hypothetical protein